MRSNLVVLLINQTNVNPYDCNVTRNNSPYSQREKYIITSSLYFIRSKICIWLHKRSINYYPTHNLLSNRQQTIQ